MFSIRPVPIGLTRLTNTCAANNPSIPYASNLMTDQAAVSSTMEVAVSQLRCIGCGAVGEEGAKSVRCAQCGDLLEVSFPGWKTNSGMRVGGLDAVGLKRLWLQRRTSS